MSKIIGIDVYSALHKPRGMGIYTINFLRELAKLDKENNYILYSDIEDFNNVLPKQSNFKHKILRARGLFHYEQVVLPNECKKDRIDILHSPANTSPIFLDKKIKRYITLHDVIFLKKEIPFAKNPKQFIGRFYYAINVILNIKKADTVFTVSDYSKNDIAKILKINLNKIVVTPNGHEHFNVENATNFEELKHKYNIPNEYFFHLGGDAPSKNTKFLLEYFKNNQDKNIIIAGIRKLENSYLYAKYKDCRNITFVPYISQEDLVSLYKNAQAFIFASLYEGFGIPLLESMKCNCPIICSNVSCLPEIAGNTALYFAPKSIEELNKCFKNLDNTEIKNKLIQAKTERLKIFKWTITAEKIRERY